MSLTGWGVLLVVAVAVVAAIVLIIRLIVRHTRDTTRQIARTRERIAHGPSPRVPSCHFLVVTATCPEFLQPWDIRPLQVKKNSGHRARTPTKTPRRSFLPGNSGQRPLLTQPLNCPY